MVILLYAQEVEILNELAAPARGQVLQDAAQAYRARASCYKEAAQAQLAAADDKRAAKLEAKSKKLAVKAEKKTDKKISPQKGKQGQIRLVNDWHEPVTVVVSGVAHFLRSGESKMIPRPAGPFTYEVQVRHHWSKRILEAGKTYTIRIHDR
jgi:hypothetical protein